MRHAQYAKLTSAAPATIVDSWLALDVDIPTFASRTTGARAPTRRLAWSSSCRANGAARACARSAAIASASTKATTCPFLRELAPGAPSSGRATSADSPSRRSACRADAMAWLGAHEADTFMHREWPARNALDWLRIEMDRPVDAAIAGWSARRRDDRRGLRRRRTLPRSCRRSSCGNARRRRRRGSSRSSPAPSASRSGSPACGCCRPRRPSTLPDASRWSSCRWRHCPGGRTTCRARSASSMPTSAWCPRTSGLDGSARPFAAIDPAAAVQAGGERLVWKAGDGDLSRHVRQDCVREAARALPPDAALARACGHGRRSDARDGRRATRRALHAPSRRQEARPRTRPARRSCRRRAKR